jgi:hypothetical protein
VILCCGSGGERGEVRVQGGGLQPGDVPHRRRGDEHVGGGQERQHLERGQLHAAALQRHTHRLLLPSGASSAPSSSRRLKWSRGRTAAAVGGSPTILGRRTWTSTTGSWLSCALSASSSSHACANITMAQVHQ